MLFLSSIRIRRSKEGPNEGFSSIGLACSVTVSVNKNLKTVLI